MSNNYYILKKYVTKINLTLKQKIIKKVNNILLFKKIKKIIKWK